MLRIVEETSERVEGLPLDLDELAREGARRMLIEALDAEVEAADLLRLPGRALEEPAHHHVVESLYPISPIHNILTLSHAFDVEVCDYH